MTHRCEQFSGNPTLTSDPALTAVELNDPRHAPTSDCGIAPATAAGAFVAVGDVGAASVPPQAATRSAAVIGRMRMPMRTRSKVQHGYRRAVRQRGLLYISSVSCLARRDCDLGEAQLSDIGVG